ncbi:MAG: protein translocase subunit SecF [Dehalococcoidales bacterium]
MIDFVGKRYWYFLLSAIIIIPGIIFLIVFGLKPGSDFKGGTDMTVHFTPNIEQNQLRQSLTSLGYGDAVIQTTGQGDFILRLPETTTADKQKLTDGLTAATGSNITVRDFASISATVASETARYAIIAVIVAALGILLYITWAFRKMPNPLRWGICAVIALMHDILLVAGIFSILGYFAGVEIDALFITGMLTVAGYSVHDTIVVFDRIRENLTKGISKNFEQVVNYSISQTLARSFNTSLTVLFVLLALFLLGGSTIHYFTLVLLIGVTTGTYSSVCNASQLLVVWENKEWGRFIGIKKSTTVKA